MFTLEAKQLSKWRDHYCVFSDVSFSLISGQGLWIRGENGAGKTSLIRIIAGLSKADEGALLWNGLSVSDEANPYNSAIHYLSHHKTLVPHLSVLETVTLLFPLMGAKAVSDIEIISQDAGLNGLEQQTVQHLSAGQKQRLSLVRLLQRNKPLWILDEPQSHLDQAGQEWLFSLIGKHLNNNGMAVIVSHAKDLPLTNIKSLDL